MEHAGVLVRTSVIYRHSRVVWAPWQARTNFASSSSSSSFIVCSCMSCVLASPTYISGSLYGLTYTSMSHMQTGDCNKSQCYGRLWIRLQVHVEVYVFEYVRAIGVSHRVNTFCVVVRMKFAVCAIIAIYSVVNVPLVWLLLLAKILKIVLYNNFAVFESVEKVCLSRGHMKYRFHRMVS